MNTATRLDDFRQAAKKAGLALPENIVPGRIVRFPGIGKSHGNTSGWAWLSEDGKGGAYGDWASGLSDTWHAQHDHAMTATERAAHSRRVAELQRIREAEERLRHADAAQRAQRLWEGAKPAPANHPYLMRKVVHPYGLRVDDKNWLIVPVTIDGNLTSTQSIDGSGAKLFLPGGAVKGGSYTIGDLTEATTILICEGYATAGTLHAATGFPVVMAFSANNLQLVAQQLRQQYPATTIIICGDNDVHADGKPNTGLIAATEAAEAIKGTLAIPDAINHNKTDWNDIHMAQGLDAVRTAIEAALTRKQETDPATSATITHFGGPDGLTRELADAILRTEHFCKDSGERLSVFVGGVYRPDGKQTISRLVKQLLNASGYSDRWTRRREQEVLAYLTVDAPILWDCPPLDTLNLQNGLLDIRSRTLTPHSPDHRSPIQLPLIYDPAATCHEWDAFIGEVFSEDCHTLAYEIVAWLLCPATSIQKAFLLRGDGENGKSTYLSAVTAALGAENVSGLSLQKLETDRFSTWRLLGKLANICPDLPSDHLTSTSIFKALVGGDRLLGEYKFGDSFEFLPFARLLFSANHFPQSKDSSYAFFRRWIVIPFDRIITEDQKRAKPDILARLTSPAELSGLLNRSLLVLPELRSRGGFVQTETTTVARAEFQEATDPLAVWLDRYTVLDPNGIVTKTDLSLMYSAESEKVGRPVVPARTLYAAIKRLRPVLQETMRRVNGNPRDVFVGLSFRENTSETVRGVSDVSAPTHLMPTLNNDENNNEMILDKDSPYAAYTPYTTPVESGVGGSPMVSETSETRATTPDGLFAEEVVNDDH
ncbi:MAG: phage/plasmid primase, P4 family [Nitrospira sp.]